MEDHSSSSPYPFAEVHLKSNAHEQAGSSYFLKDYLYLLASTENARPELDGLRGWKLPMQCVGFFKRKQGNNCR